MSEGHPIAPRHPECRGRQQRVLRAWRRAGPKLLLLDNAAIYNASHLFGFFSVFNADAISSVEVYKGSMPARFGGRVSSVLDLGLKEGNRKELKGSGGIGLISSRLTLEGPVKRACPVSSCRVAGRTSTC